MEYSFTPCGPTAAHLRRIRFRVAQPTAHTQTWHLSQRCTDTLGSRVASGVQGGSRVAQLPGARYVPRRSGLPSLDTGRLTATVSTAASSSSVATNGPVGATSAAPKAAAAPSSSKLLLLQAVAGVLKGPLPVHQVIHHS
jgi:hypothetical protein